MSYVSSKPLGVVDKLLIKKKLFAGASNELGQCFKKECQKGSDDNTFYSTMCNYNLARAQAKLDKKIKSYVNKKILSGTKVEKKRTVGSRRMLAMTAAAPVSTNLNKLSTKAPATKLPITANDTKPVTKPATPKVTALTAEQKKREADTKKV